MILVIIIIIIIINIIIIIIVVIISILQLKIERMILLVYKVRCLSPRPLITDSSNAGFNNRFDKYCLAKF